MTSLLLVSSAWARASIAARRSGSSRTGTTSAGADPSSGRPRRRLLRSLTSCRDGTAYRSAGARHQHRMPLSQAECVVESSAWCGVWSATTHSDPSRAPAPPRPSAKGRASSPLSVMPARWPRGSECAGRRCRAVVLSARRRWHDAVGGCALCTRHRGGAETAVSALSLRLAASGRPTSPPRSEVSSVTALKGAARTER